MIGIHPAALAPARPLATATAGVLSVALAACGPGSGGGSPAVGEQAPEYALSTLGGEGIRLADYRGEPVLLNFWATWCTPCRTETPFLQSLHELYEDRGLRVIGVSMDSPGSLDEIRSFVGEMGVTYDILHDSRQAGMDRFSIMGLPATYVLDRGGEIRFMRIGPVSESDREFLSALDEVTS